MISINKSENANIPDFYIHVSLNQLFFIRLLLVSTDQYHLMLIAILIDINKMKSTQRYNIMRNKGNRKDKDGNLRIFCLKYNKKGGYKGKKE